MLQQHFARGAQVAVLLEAVVEEVLHDGRRAFRDRRAVVLHIPEQGGHRSGVWYGGWPSSSSITMQSYAPVADMGEKFTG